ncbi:MAG: DinB family protein [Ginsengibacter sp.]
MRNWNEQIDDITQKFIESFENLTSEQMNWKPDPDTWSIAQNIDHLIVINNSYFAMIDSIKKGTYKAPFLSRIGFIVSFLGNTILKSVQPDRKKKMKTFTIWEPGKSNVAEGILKTFEEKQSKLKSLIENSKDLLDKGVIISSPANKNIVYKLEKAFEIIVTHERRHFNQSKEVYELLKETIV